MTVDLPAPLVPAEVDLRDFAFMPLDVVRLRDSGLTAKASGDEFRAAVLLWCASWHQVPAGSLPDDDDELANVCGYSRARREWAKIRAGSMRGWVRCSDGRLYHAAVAGKALEAWIEKLASAIGGAVGNAKRWNVSIDTERMRGQFVSAVDALRAIDPQSRTLRKKAVAVITSPSPPESPPDITTGSPPESGADRKGQGQGQGQGVGSVPTGTGGGAAEQAPTEPGMTAAERRKSEAWRAAKSLLHEHGMPKAQTGTFLGKLHTDCGNTEQFLAIVEEAVAARPAEPEAWLRAACQRRNGARGGNRQEALEQRNSQVAAEWAARGGHHATQ